jgi:hypothetical protein
MEVSIGAVLSRARKAIEHNTAQRAKYAESPNLFVDSEIELSGALEACRAAAAGDIEQSAGSELVLLLVNVLSHPNVDIVGLSVGALMDLMQSSSDLIRVFLKAEGFTLLVQSLSILNAESQDELEVFDHVLSIIENAIDQVPDPIAKSLLSQELMVDLLLGRMKAAIADKSGADDVEFDQLGLYCSEILAILMQATQTFHSDEFAKIMEKHKELIASLLEIARYYSTQDPSSKDETEFAANSLNCLSEIILNNNSESVNFQRQGGLDVCLNLMR